MMNFSCPICSKAGLLDYTAKHVVCPQCNSDLKPFLLLHSFSKRKSRKTIFLSFSIIILVAFAILYFNLFYRQKQTVSDHSVAIFQLQDSIKTLRSVISEKHSSNPNSISGKKEIYIRYRVKKGDYLSRIAQFFYNDWKKYEQIEIDNNLKQPYVLKVGQGLTIKLTEEQWK